MALQDSFFSAVTVKPDMTHAVPVEIGPGRWLCVAYPYGHGSYVVEASSVSTVRRGWAHKERAVVEDFWAARACSALRQWRFETDRVRGELKVRGWTVAQVLGTDGRWHVVASKLVGSKMDSREFCPDEVDFRAWIEHL